MSSTLNVHKELLFSQTWIHEMTNSNREIIESENSPQKLALLQHQTCVLWISRCLSNIARQYTHDGAFYDEQFVQFIEVLVEESYLHPSLFVTGLLYFDHFLKKNGKEMKFSNIKV